MRHAIVLFENTYHAAEDVLTEADLEAFHPGGTGLSDDIHYDLLSCLQKSIRGSDPDAAVFYLAKLLSAGELLSACRRLQVIASEDVGLAYPLAAAVTRACCESAKDLGMPEAQIPLANAVILLATAPKSKRRAQCGARRNAGCAVRQGRPRPGASAKSPLPRLPLPTRLPRPLCPPALSSPRPPCRHEILHPRSRQNRASRRRVLAEHQEPEELNGTTAGDTAVPSHALQIKYVSS